VADGDRLRRRILLAGYPFDGPYPSPDDLEDRPGVRVVLVHEEGSAWRPIDVKATGGVVSKVRALRSDDLVATGAPIGFAATYDESDQSRRQIERHIRARYGLTGP
jgi:hypothetical protein